eukprot:312015-Karenia_brevis.AAC.1
MSNFDERNRKFRLILYQLPSGTYEQSVTDDVDGISTLPKTVRTNISKLLKSPKVTICLELESIPEDTELKDEQIDGFPNTLPEERIEDNPDADPGSDDEHEHQLNMSWQPSAAQLADL